MLDNPTAAWTNIDLNKKCISFSPNSPSKFTVISRRFTSSISSLVRSTEKKKALLSEGSKTVHKVAHFSTLNKSCLKLNEEKSKQLNRSPSLYDNLKNLIETPDAVKSGQDWRELIQQQKSELGSNDKYQRAFQNSKSPIKIKPILKNPMIQNNETPILKRSNSLDVNLDTSSSTVIVDSNFEDEASFRNTDEFIKSLSNNQTKPTLSFRKPSSDYQRHKRSKPRNGQNKRIITPFESDCHRQTFLELVTFLSKLFI